MEKLIPLLYFFAGGFTVIAYLLWPKEEKKVEKKDRSWSKISSLDYHLDVDHTFSKEMTGQQMAYAMAEVMKIKIEKEKLGLDQIVIDAGSYSINCSTVIRFIHRDK